ncbi:MAG TPA: hypothetical protein VI757_16080 [Bacteroidia bacterium]|nr:hypothetical protein [Bacteroidia bacterium]
MELKYSKKFVRQLRQYRNDEKFFQILSRKIRHIESVNSPAEISELVRIRKTSAHYRIKIKLSDRIVYRIGISVFRNTVWFASIENDKKRFYRQFP